MVRGTRRAPKLSNERHTPLNVGYASWSVSSGQLLPGWYARARCHNVMGEIILPDSGKVFHGLSRHGCGRISPGRAVMPGILILPRQGVQIIEQPRQGQRAHPSGEWKGVLPCMHHIEAL